MTGQSKLFKIVILIFHCSRKETADDVFLEEECKDYGGNHCEHTSSDDGDIVDINVIGKHSGNYCAGERLFGLGDQ